MKIDRWRSVLSLLLFSLLFFLVGIPKTYAGCDFFGCDHETSHDESCSSSGCHTPNIPAGENCAEWRGLMGAQVSAATGVGTVTNNSRTCTFTVTLASYKAFQPLSGDLNYLYTQQLFDSKSGTVAPGQTISLQVALPSCLRQIDFFRGNGYSSFNPGNYQAVVADNMAADFPQNMPLCQQAVPTPTMTPFPTATPTPNPYGVQQYTQPTQTPLQQVQSVQTYSTGGQPVYTPPQQQQLPQTPSTGPEMWGLLSLIPSGVVGTILKRKRV